MQAKSVICKSVQVWASLLFLGILTGSAAEAQDDAVKAPPPIPIVLFDSPAAYGDSVPRLVVQTRDALRTDKRVEPLLFSPDSPTFTLAAKSADPPLDVNQITSDGDEVAIASAVDASYYAVLTETADGKKLTATIYQLSSSTQQVISKEQTPAATATSIASLIENWPAAAAPTAAVQLPTQPANPVQTPVPADAPVITTTPITNAVPVSATPTPIATPETSPPPTTTASAAPADAGPVLSAGDTDAVVAPTLDLNPASPKPAPGAPATMPVQSSAVASAASDDTNRSPTVTISNVTVSASPTTSTDMLSTVQPGVTISSEAQKLINAGDAAIQGSDNLTAISDYEKAVSLAPRAAGPRLKLANAYLEAGMKDEAAQEARRALAIDPGNADVQNFIRDQSSGADGPGGDVIIAQAQTESDPNNPAAWISLGDAYWNVGDPDDSLISYKHAADIDPNAILPQTRLAKLYAAREQYDESLAALQRSGTAGYPYALRIIASRSESIVGDLDDETNQYSTAQYTREQFYDKVKATDQQAENLADFVAKITAPDQYKVSQLHRELSTRLLAQTASVWVDYVETNNADDKSEAADLEKHAIDEMKTASIAEDLQSHIKP